MRVEHQRDTFFHARTGRLKLRERTWREGQDTEDRSDAELIPYERSDTGGARESRYHVVPVIEPAALIAGLALAGPAQAQTKLKWAHVYEPAEPFHTESVWAAGEIARFDDDIEALGLLPSWSEPRATSAIADIRGFIGMVLDRGHAYTAGGAVYFAVGSWDRFGEISHYDQDEMLRLAANRLCDAGLVPSMLVHDGILFELDNEEQVQHAIEIMRIAGTEVCGGLEIGVWEMTPGVMTDVEADEVFVVLSGSATIEFADGTATLRVGPGDVVRLAAGAETVWTVAETLRKVYLTPAG